MNRRQNLASTLEQCGCVPPLPENESRANPWRNTSQQAGHVGRQRGMLPCHGLQRRTATAKCNGEVQRRSATADCDGELQRRSATAYCDGELQRRTATANCNGGL